MTTPGKASAWSRAIEALLIGQPMILATALVLEHWAGEATDLRVLLRPVVVILVATGVVTVVLRALSRSWPVAILVTDMLVAFTFREFLMAAVAAAVLLAWAVLRIGFVLMRRPKPSAQIAWAMVRATGIFILALFLLATFDVARAVAAAQPELALPRYELESGDRPNIYVVMLDGYPRSDTLSDSFDVDNRAFLDALEDRGFAVSESARTNYNKTWLTMASMLNGAYMDELLSDQTPPHDPAAQLRWLHAFINQASIPAALEDAGYRIRTVASPYTSSTIASADDVITGPPPNDFELGLITPSPWTTLFRDEIGSVLFGGQADRVAESLEWTVELAEDDDPEPKFVFAHVHSPHAPFVLRDDADQPARVAECYPIDCYFYEVRLDSMGISPDEYATRLGEQIHALDGLVVDALDRIVAADPNAVVIVMSDHGLRYSAEDVSEHYRSLLAARTPNHPNLFSQDESPVNILRRVLAAYFDADVEPLPYRAWKLDWFQNLELEEFSPEAGAWDDLANEPERDSG